VHHYLPIIYNSLRINTQFRYCLTTTLLYSTLLYHVSFIVDVVTAALLRGHVVIVLPFDYVVFVLFVLAS
jgi:hypothetical protein